MTSSRDPATMSGPLQSGEQVRKAVGGWVPAAAVAVRPAAAPCQRLQLQCRQQRRLSWRPRHAPISGTGGAATEIGWHAAKCWHPARACACPRPRRRRARRRRSMYRGRVASARAPPLARPGLPALGSARALAQRRAARARCLPPPLAAASSAASAAASAAASRRRSAAAACLRAGAARPGVRARRRRRGARWSGCSRRCRRPAAAAPGARRRRRQAAAPAARRRPTLGPRLACRRRRRRPARAPRARIRARGGGRRRRRRRHRGRDRQQPRRAQRLGRLASRRAAGGGVRL